MGLIDKPDPIVLQLYSEVLQKFRLAAQGHGDVQPPAEHRRRVTTNFDPLPLWYMPFEEAEVALDAFPLHAITQRPMAMYHSWRAQNAWPRQIHGDNRLYIHRATAAELGIADDDWVAVTSNHRRIKAQARLMDGVNPSTVWTWNAIGKRSGTWNLAPKAGESQHGFLLNHVISELLPERGDGHRYSNCDPVTGQVAWYDLRVRIEKVAAEEGVSEPQFATLPTPPCLPKRPGVLRYGADFRAAAHRDASDQPARTTFGQTPGLVIDLDICVGCHACAVNCKEWNTGGVAAPLTEFAPYDADPDGVWFNRVHTYEVGEGPAGRTVHFPRSCPHCAERACVTVCPTGASFKRAEDGIVLINEDLCIGCKLCSWAGPYGAREFDEDAGVMKKCTLCIDRIYNTTFDADDRVPACVATCPASARHFGDLGDPNSAVSKLVAEREGFDLMAEMGYAPTNKYLPPRPRRQSAGCTGASAQLAPATPAAAGGLLGWLDRLLSQ